ncbi:MAG: hypothetical protein IJL85_05900 [Erysipelotrichaceae bacterium]|nr:hypothetical protein [Erysipelotrichaceae bacterium]
MLKLTEAAESSTNTTIFIYVIFSFMILIFLFRAALGYRHYKTSIFPHIYDNYLLDYYYKLNVFQDASVSQLLKKKIGYHRLVYANIANKEGKLASHILTLIHGKGILSIAYLSSDGKISGGDSGFWNIQREEDGQKKKYRIENPAVYLKEYISHLHQVLGDRKIESVIAVSDGCDISDVHSSFKVVNYSQLDEVIAQTDCGYGLNETEIDEIFKKLGGKTRN